VLALPVFILEAPEALGYHVEHGPRVLKWGVLREPSDAQAGLPPDAARVRRQLAADDLQQRRFAGAVAPDDADALAGLNLEAGVVEQRKVSEGERHVIERDEGHVWGWVESRED
jgi:hypothetical protein